MNYGKFKTIMMWVGIISTVYMFGASIMWVIEYIVQLAEQVKSAVPQ